MRQSILIILIILSLFGFESRLNAQKIDVEDTTGVEDTTSLRVEDLSFLFDETITKIGADFFRLFHSEWESPASVRGVSIYVGEKPVPGMGTQIWIKVDERFIYRAMLKPNAEQIRQEAKKALALTRNYFLNYQAIQKQLGSQDYSGNGIY